MESVAAILAVAALWLAVLPGCAFGQRQSEQPIRTSLCELIKKPRASNGKMVQFRAEFVSRFQWDGFVDNQCSAALPSGGATFSMNGRPGTARLRLSAPTTMRHNRTSYNGSRFRSLTRSISRRMSRTSPSRSRCRWKRAGNTSRRRTRMDADKHLCFSRRRSAFVRSPACCYWQPRGAGFSLPCLRPGVEMRLDAAPRSACATLSPRVVQHPHMVI